MLFWYVYRVYILHTYVFSKNRLFSYYKQTLKFYYFINRCIDKAFIYKKCSVSNLLVNLPFIVQGLLNLKLDGGVSDIQKY